MKNKITLKILFVVMAIVVMTCSMPVFAAQNLFNPDESFDELYIFTKRGETGVFTNSENGISTGSETFYLPNLTRNYTFSGHIKIVEIGDKAWNGVRIIIGSSINGACKLVITKEWGIRFEFKGSNLGDKLWDPGLRLAANTEFDFEVIRVENNVTLKIDGEEVGTVEVEEALDTFDEEGDYNLGFESSDSWFEVSNISVICEEAEAKITPTPEVTATPETTTTPEITATPDAPVASEEVPGETNEIAATTAPATSEVTKTPDNDNTTDSEDGGISPIVIVVCVVAVIAVAVVVVILLKGKKTGK